MLYKTQGKIVNFQSKNLKRLLLSEQRLVDLDAGIVKIKKKRQRKAQLQNYRKSFVGQLRQHFKSHSVVLEQKGP